MNPEIKIPENLQKVILQFHSQQLRYNLFKCEHIFQGENKNLDILLETIEDYDQASRWLEAQGFVLVFPEQFEKYKRMYVDFYGGILTAVHLHREISWHGLRIINKEKVFNKARMIAPGLYVPCFEDSLIIHIAHIVFENLKIRPRDAKVIRYYLEQDLNWPYINRILEESGWRKQFYDVKRDYELESPLNKKKLYLVLLTKGLRQPSSWVPLARKLYRKIKKPFQFKKRGYLIALIGVNGSGKTTLTKLLSEVYQPATCFLSGQQSYYFGWYPFSTLSKIISKILNCGKWGIYDHFNANLPGSNNCNNNQNKVQNPAVIEVKPGYLEELFYLYNYLEYLWRYYWQIYPSLRKNQLVITDRYFYDLYGQYKNAPHSRILRTFLVLFPKPQATFILDAPLSALQSRGKQPNTSAPIDKSSHYRKIHSETDLSGQLERFKQLSAIINGRILDTTLTPLQNVQTMVSVTWKEYFSKDK